MLGVIVGLIVLGTIAGVASVMYNVQFGELPQILQGVFQRRNTANEVDYQELRPTAEREPLVSRT